MVRVANLVKDILLFPLKLFINIYFLVYFLYYRLFIHRREIDDILFPIGRISGPYLTSNTFAKNEDYVYKGRDGDTIVFIHRHYPCGALELVGVSKRWPLAILDLEGVKRLQIIKEKVDYKTFIEAKREGR